ncbi:glycoside hydrolase family 31 protein [Coraliomargarita parva]|uniref:glycoside hydrolase family 31 protein n=1 Tax=Coraliomargarita parva TaxID=3014050 RepID=UPI0022B34A96|nr:glycoside hydrolase family 31 protein [Coraliomargarita parva]
MSSRQLKYTLSDGTTGLIETDSILEIPAGEVVAVDLASGGHWYGHGFNHVQHYPLEQGTVVNEAFAVNNIQAPIWMCSSGVALLAETKRVLDVHLNEGNDGSLRIACPGSGFRLVCKVAATLPQAQAKLMAHLGWPNLSPAADVFGDSFFCTWTQYPRCINQERILEMGRQIKARGYPCSTLIIDDRWESSFGELDFGPDFPHATEMIRELHELGLKVWLWVTPFVNTDSTGFEDLVSSNVLVPNKDGQGAALFRWWGGTAGLIDVTAAQGREWLQGKLKHLQEHYGVDGFKIDGGDFKYQPSPEIADWHDFAGESGYSDVLLAAFEELVPNLCESRAAWLSQGRSVIWRQGGKDSHWGTDNGLSAMVRLALHLSLMGYDLLIPDMVPGRVQTMNAEDPLPTDELMVRWTEVTAFMPFMQFSYFPWNYSPGTEITVRQYALLHKVLEGYLADQARGRTAPLVRPLWYDAPEDSECYTIADEFLLGSDILVAPVLKSGETARDILLPSGRWKDAWTGDALASGWHRGYAAPCPGIPVFVRAEREDLLRLLSTVLSMIDRGGIEPGRLTATHSAGLTRDLSVTG